MCCKPDPNPNVCSIAQVHFLEKHQGLLTPREPTGWRTGVHFHSHTQVETQMVSQGSIWCVFGVWYVQTFALSFMRSVTTKGTPGLETMQECSPSPLWCVQRSMSPKSPPGVRHLPGHLQIVSSKFIKHISRWRKYAYIENLREILGVFLEEMFDSRQTHEPNI